LATNNVDTGLGLERLAAVMQGKVSDYEIDVFAPLVSQAAELLHLPAGGEKGSGVVFLGGEEALVFIAAKTTPDPFF